MMNLLGCWGAPDSTGSTAGYPTEEGREGGREGGGESL